MKTKTYSVHGNPTMGHYITVPAAVGWTAGQKAECEIQDNGDTLVYRRVKRK